MKTIQGEWWLIGGKAVFADGADGNNHEGVVWGHVFRDFVSDLRSDRHDFSSGLADEVSLLNPDNCDPTMLRTIINDFSDSFARSSSSVTDDEREAIYDDPGEWLMKQLEWDKDKWSVLADSGGSVVEARLWAAKTLGWIRMAGNCLQVYGPLSKAKASHLAAGLHAVSESPHEGYTEWHRELFDMEVSFPDRCDWYRNIPFAVLLDKSPSRLREFLTTSFFKEH